MRLRRVFNLRIPSERKLSKMQVTCLPALDPELCCRSLQYEVQPWVCSFSESPFQRPSMRLCQLCCPSDWLVRTDTLAPQHVTPVHALV